MLGRRHRWNIKTKWPAVICWIVSGTSLHSLHVAEGCRGQEMTAITLQLHTTFKLKE